MEVQAPSSPPPPAAGDPSKVDPLAAEDLFSVVFDGDCTFHGHPYVGAETEVIFKESAPPAVGPPPDTDGATDSSCAADQYDVLRHRIVRQVEYYFSDENLPTDKFLMKHIKKDKDGYVPIAVVSSFRKLKKLTKDLELIEAALKTSSLLVVSSDGEKVKRLRPLQDNEVKDAKPRIVIVENLPEDHSEENIRRIFGNVGRILDVTICDPTEELAISKKGDLAISSKLHALIEYETVEAAENAVRLVSALNDEMDWRSGMRVGILQKRMEKYGLIQKARREIVSDNNCDTEASEKPSEDESAEKQNEDVRRGKYKSKNRGHHIGRGNVPKGSVIEDGGSSIKPFPGPRMPDGTRGFTLGRGRTVTT
ncbi:hypothetical protein AXF42_Ash006790 [Apostasia shenzhenica]|uniref:La-related protein 6A n=1 Tax=Apostasia shenzhenica TaxID=1088818 RepID=A0A2I0AJ67_9ASPA|nr:hypothetical protein AXF42_Ash006790 [Apostasia shenzhenica]